MRTSTICLVMIVKNESAIIKETLESVYPYIHRYCISDTGSSDDTCSIIQSFFKEKNIPGTLHHDIWKHFGHNRTLAFQHAKDTTTCDYMLVMDADDLIVGSLVLPEPLDKDAYSLKFGEFTSYQRLQLFKSSLRWKYEGVVHEYVSCLSKPKDNVEIGVIEGSYFIESRRFGSRNQNPIKYLQDAQVMIAELSKEGISQELISRYLFYIGQSFFEHGDYQNAIDYFEQRRFKLQNTELYWTYFYLARSYYMLDSNRYKKEIISYFMKGYLMMNHRSECPYFLALYYQEKHSIGDALETLRLCKDLVLPTNETFLVMKPIYEYQARLRFIQLSEILQKETEQEVLQEWNTLLVQCPSIVDKVDIRMFPSFYHFLESRPAHDSLSSPRKCKHIKIDLSSRDHSCHSIAWKSLYYFMLTPYHYELDDTSEYKLVWPHEWIMVKQGDWIEQALAHFRSNPSLVRVYITTPKEVSTQCCDSPCNGTVLYPYVERVHPIAVSPQKDETEIDMSQRSMHLSSWTCTLVAKIPSHFEKGVLSDYPSKFIVYSLQHTTTSWMKDILSSYFLYCMAHEKNIEFRLSTIMYEESIPLRGSWKTKGEFLEDLLYMTYMKDSSFYRLEWITEHRWNDFVRHLGLGHESNDSILQVDQALEGTFSLSLLSYSSYKVSYYKHPLVPLLLVLHSVCNVPVEWCVDKLDNLSVVPWHVVDSHTKTVILSSLEPMEVWMIHKHVNHILHEIPVLRIVTEQGDIRGDHYIVMEQDYELLYPFLEWYPKMMDFLLTIRMTMVALPWSCIMLSSSSSDFYMVHKCVERAVEPDYTVPFFRVQHLERHMDYLLFPHIHFVGRDIYYHPTDYKKGDAYNTYGFSKRFLPHHYPMVSFVYDDTFEGDFVNVQYFNRSCDIKEFGKKTWNFVTMNIPQVRRGELPIYCVNLERRLDRKKQMMALCESNHLSVHFVKAIDGKQLSPSKELFNFYVGNHIGHKPGLIGCALSHILLWDALRKDPHHDYYVILEDDIMLSTHAVFAHKTACINMHQIMKQLTRLSEWDVLFLGYTRRDPTTVSVLDNHRGLYVLPLSGDYLGGTFAYVIHKKCAAFLLNVISQFGMFIAIDNIWHYYAFVQSFLKLYKLSIDFMISEWVRPGGHGDSDIQLESSQIEYCRKTDFITLKNVIPCDPLTLTEKPWKNMMDYAGTVKYSMVYLGFTSSCKLLSFIPTRSHGYSHKLRFQECPGTDVYLHREKLSSLESMVVSLTSSADPRQPCEVLCPIEVFSPLSTHAEDECLQRIIENTILLCRK